MVADLITYLMWITINEWELRSVVVTEYLCTYLGWTKIVDLNSKTIIPSIHFSLALSQSKGHAAMPVVLIVRPI